MSEPAHMPACIGIIMDGNRRWAREHDRALLEGHRAGLDKLKEVTRWAQEAGVAYLIFYAFSTENWNRSKDEVEYLLELFDEAIGAEFEELKERKIRVRFAGQRERFSEALQQKMRALEEETAENGGGTVVLAVSYGGRAELVQAANELAQAGKESVTEQDIEEHLWTAGIPDPDIIIRTGGEQRLSGFLPWQGVYSELFFTATRWPDFGREEFESMLSEYGSRQRRHGR